MGASATTSQIRRLRVGSYSAGCDMQHDYRVDAQLSAIHSYSFQGGVSTLRQGL